MRHHKVHKRKKYPRHCCKKCHVLHRTAAGARAHHRELMGGHPHRRKRMKKTGFAKMSVKRRTAIARKGGKASARARGYR